MSVPCRTLKTEGRKGMEEDQIDSGFLAKMRNKVHTASLAVAKLTAPPEKPPKKSSGIDNLFI